MHSAPTVSYPVGRSHFQAWLLGLTAVGGVVTGVLWRQAADPGGWRSWLFAMTLLGTCTVATRAWRHAPQGRLRWDGQAWRWTGVNVSTCGVLTVHLDLQFCLVLSLRSEDGARLWLWPERTREVALWNALRRAVFSRSIASQPQDAKADADGVPP